MDEHLKPVKWKDNETHKEKLADTYRLSAVAPFV
jgi:hypothetical protein